MSITRDFAPRLMPVTQAAHYLGVSETTLRGLPISRRELGGKRLYDSLDLDAFADSLASETTDDARSAHPQGRENTCKGKFGRRVS